MDNLTPSQRHTNMKNIKSKDTKIELVLRKALWNKNIHYRKNYTLLHGKPDIVLTKYKIAIFCDGEFFHGYDWETQKQRLENSTNSEYWTRKISRNIERDSDVDRQLFALGWTAVHFWGKYVLKHTDECVKYIEELIYEYNIEKSYRLDTNPENYFD